MGVHWTDSSTTDVAVYYNGRDLVTYNPYTQDYAHLVKTSYPTSYKSLRQKKVIFNPPATIVIWEDGSKTVVKCNGDDYFDAEKGLALCYMKKALGNKGNFNNKIREALLDNDWYEE